MPNLERRLHILLSEEDHKFLEELSQKKHCSLGELVRQALEQSYLPSSSYKALAALERLEKTPSLFLDEKQWSKVFRDRGGAGEN